MRNIALFVAVLGLAACTGSGPNGPDDSTDTDVVNPNAKAFLDLDVFTDGDSTPCNVFIDDQLVGRSDELIEIPAGIEVTVQLGNADTWTGEENTRPIHELDGLQWVYPDIVVEASENETVQKTVQMNRYFADNYACTTRVCLYDPDAPGGFGDVCDPLITQDVQFISVEQGFIVVPSDEPSMAVFGTIDRLEVAKDVFTFEVLHGTVLERSEIRDDDSFTATFIDSIPRILELDCTP